MFHRDAHIRNCKENYSFTLIQLCFYESTVILLRNNNSFLKSLVVVVKICRMSFSYFSHLEGAYVRDNDVACTTLETDITFRRKS